MINPCFDKILNNLSHKIIGIFFQALVTIFQLDFLYLSEWNFASIFEIGFTQISNKVLRKIIYRKPLV